MKYHVLFCKDINLVVIGTIINKIGNTQDIRRTRKIVKIVDTYTRKRVLHAVISRSIIYLLVSVFFTSRFHHKYAHVLFKKKIIFLQDFLRVKYYSKQYYF